MLHGCGSVNYCWIGNPTRMCCAHGQALQASAQPSSAQLSYIVLPECRIRNSNCHSPLHRHSGCGQKSIQGFGMRRVTKRTRLFGPDDKSQIAPLCTLLLSKTIQRVSTDLRCRSRTLVLSSRWICNFLLHPSLSPASIKSLHEAVVFMPVRTM